MTRLRKVQRGAFAIWFAILSPMLIAVFALALETSYLLVKQHRQQLVTDMAALSAGLQLLREDAAGALTAAQASIHMHALETQSIELDLLENETGQRYRLTVTSTPVRVLTRFLGNERFELVTHASVQMRRGTCLLALAPGGSGLTVAANATILGDTCNAQVNSASLGPINASIVIGNAASVSLHSIRTVGGSNVSGSATVEPAIVTGAATATDPLTELAAPPFTGCTYNNVVVRGTQTLTPGTYCGGITVNANAKAILSPGNYLLHQGGLDTKRNASVTGNGVTIFLLSGGSFNFDTSTLLDLSAQQTGTYAGILLFESHSVVPDANLHTLPVLRDSTVDGLIYTPNSRLRVVTDSNKPANENALSASMIAYRISLEGRLRFPSDEEFLAAGMGQRVWLSE